MRMQHKLPLEIRTNVSFVDVSSFAVDVASLVGNSTGTGRSTFFFLVKISVPQTLQSPFLQLFVVCGFYILQFRIHPFRMKL